MSLPIDRVDAVGGDLTAGDRVDVISVAGGEATYIAVDLEVIDTQTPDGRSGALTTNALSTYYVTVSIDDQTALAVALALETGEVTVLRSTGAEPVPADERVLAPAVEPRPSLAPGGTTGLGTATDPSTDADTVAGTGTAAGDSAADGRRARPRATGMGDGENGG